MGDPVDALDATLGASHTGSSSGPVEPRPARDDRYRLGPELARGGMGRIVVAHDLALDREVALKEVLHANAEVLARFRREAHITARLQHPGIVPIYEAGVDARGLPFYVMRLVRGRSLEAEIDARPTFRDRLDLLAHLAAAIDAVAYAHSRNIIHRDLKPANVLVGAFGETVVIDWGLAKDLHRAERDDPVGPYRTAAAPGETEAGAIMGTPLYMPPEQARGESVDARADVYALGAMMHHVLAGEPPFGGASLEEVLCKVIAEPPRALPDEIPADLRAIVVKAMARSPGDRYRDAGELATDVKSCLAGRLIGAHQYSAAQLASRWLRRPWVAAALAIALVVVAVVAAIWIIHLEGITHR